METVGRFAPSPSGRLHLGNLLCALLVWLSARQKDGRVLLRVEDLDTARCPRRYSEQMERDLQWLGLDWDIGPGRDNGTGPYYQSQRTEIYQAALETLREKGLLTQADGTVTLCHSKTPDLADITRQADILVSAVGKVNCVTVDMVKDGAVVIDVAMNRNEAGKLCGDVDLAAVEPKASYITPVPGGVGPMTRAMLMRNILTAAEAHLK